MNLQKRVCLVFIKKGIAALIIALLLECFWYNFRYWESLAFPSYNSEFDFSIGRGLTCIGERLYMVSDKDTAYLEFSNINNTVKNLYLSIEPEYQEYSDIGVIPVSIYKCDDADSAFTELPQTEISYGITEGQYKRLYLSGNAHSIRVLINEPIGTDIVINSYGLNQIRPFCFHLYRLIIVFLIVLIILAFMGSRSSLFGQMLNFHDPIQKVIISCAVILCSCVMLASGLSCRPDKWLYELSDFELDYEKVAESLSHGQLHFLEEPPKWLVDMEDPYDYGARMEFEEETGEKPLWDVAFYNGRYYSYFGVVPVILCYLPYRLITGNTLQSWIPVLPVGVILTIGCFVLIYAFVRRFFSGISLGSYLLMSVFLLASSWAPSLIQRGTKYSIPFIFGLTFAIWGLAFWILSYSEFGINKPQLTIGSLLLALVFGCRPQIGLVVFIAFPLFWNAIKQKEFFSRKGLGNTLCVFIPFVSVAILLMLYNYARFSSPFDFGATYNLTIFNMPKNVISIRKGFIGLFRFFFEPMNFTERFPYVRRTDHTATYQGFLSYEEMMGGYFMMNILGFMAIAGLLFEQVKQHTRWFTVQIYLVAVAVISALFDVEMVGTVDRYISDFAWMLSLASIGSVFLLIDPLCQVSEDHTVRTRRVARLSIFCIVMLSVFISILVLFSTSRQWNICRRFPKLYYLIQYHLFDFMN